MIIAGVEWIPPDGMENGTVKGWAAFYRDCARFGVTPQDYRALYLAQRGRCFICRTARGKHPDDPKGAGSQRLGIDHSHAHGERRTAVRALLCTRGDRSCNRIIGWIGYEALGRARTLLMEMPAQAVLARVRESDPTDFELTGMLT